MDIEYLLKDLTKEDKIMYLQNNLKIAKDCYEINHDPVEKLWILSIEKKLAAVRSEQE